jgi:Putative transposase of IS4/5 family (DUF4096)
MLWRTRTGSPWRDLPAEFGKWKTVYMRHRRWSWDACSMSCAGDVTRSRGGIGRWEWIPLPRGHISTRRVRHARRRPCPTQGALSNDKIRADVHDREALGRSRGGLTTKVHVVADRRCRPVARVITSGQRHDSIAFTAVMDRIRIHRRGPGPAPHPPRPDPGRQGVLKPSHPKQPAPPGHPGVHPRACRPTSPSRPARPTRQPATHLRRRDLQVAQRRGALHQQAQATPGRCHPLRQARVHVPGNRRRSTHQDLAARPGFLIQLGRP